MLHVDLDQFIAAVEVLRHPELAGKPVIVGGRGDPTERAVVSTASYEAREFGVGSGMPLRIAARKVPDAVILPVDAPAYTAASDEVMATLRAQPGAVVQVLGWDEAFVGVAHRRSRGVRAAAAAGGARADRAALQRRHRRHARPRQGRDRIRQAARRLPADRRQLAGGDGRPAHDRPLGRRHQDLAAAGGARHPHRRRTGRAPTRPRSWPSSARGWVSGTASSGAATAAAVVDDTPWVARGHGRETTYQQDLTEPARSSRRCASWPAGARGRRGRGPAGRRPDAEGAVRAVLHEDLHEEDRRRPSTATSCRRRSWSWSRGSSPTGRSGCSACAPRWRCPTMRARGTRRPAAAGEDGEPVWLRRDRQALSGSGAGSGASSYAGSGSSTRPLVEFAASASCSSHRRLSNGRRLPE